MKEPKIPKFLVRKNTPGTTKSIHLRILYKNRMWTSDEYKVSLKAARKILKRIAPDLPKLAGRVYSNESVSLFSNYSMGRILRKIEPKALLPETIITQEIKMVNPNIVPVTRDQKKFARITGKIVVLKALCRDFDPPINPRNARAHLRDKMNGEHGHKQRWEWADDDPDLPEIIEDLEEQFDAKYSGGS